MIALFSICSKCSCNTTALPLPEEASAGGWLAWGRGLGSGCAGREWLAMGPVLARECMIWIRSCSKNCKCQFCHGRGCYKYVQQPTEMDMRSAGPDISGSWTSHVDSSPDVQQFALAAPIIQGDGTQAVQRPGAQSPKHVCSACQPESFVQHLDILPTRIGPLDCMHVGIT